MLFIYFWPNNEKNLNFSYRQLTYCFSKYSSWISIHFAYVNHFLKNCFYSDVINSRTWVLNASTTFSGVEIRCTRNLFWEGVKEKMSLASKSEFYGGWLINSMFWTFINSFVLPRCESVRSRIFMMTNYSFFLSAFYEFLRWPWQTNVCVSFIRNFPSLLRLHSHHVTGTIDETGNHLLRCGFTSNNFCWIWLIMRKLCSRLLFFCLFICIDTWFIICIDVVHSLWWILNVFFLCFLALIDTSLF